MQELPRILIPVNTLRLKKGNKMLYFSYGSNMSVRRLLDRVPSAKFITIATLHEHDLRFHKKSKDGSGKCDAHKTNNHEHFIMGVVFEIAESEKPKLDKKEGLGYGYKEKTIRLTAQSGELITASTYYATDIDPTRKPYEWYKHHVLMGAQENNLPVTYITKIKNTESVNDPKPERHQREMAIYANN